jgi:trk system potassium uptake protein TrkA
MRQFAVIGLGRFGFQVAETLAEKGASVIAVDIKETLVEKAKNIVSDAMQLDSTDEDALKASGIANVDVAVVSMGEDVESSILTTALLKNMGIKEIVARATTDLHAQILDKVGATRVVFPEKDMGLRVAHSILAPGVLDYFELGADYNLAEISIKGEFVGKSLREIALRKKFGVTEIMMMRRVWETTKEGKPVEKQVRELSDPDYVVKEGDILVVVGNSKNLETLEKHVK